MIPRTTSIDDHYILHLVVAAQIQIILPHFLHTKTAPFKGLPLGVNPRVLRKLSDSKRGGRLNLAYNAPAVGIGS